MVDLISFFDLVIFKCLLGLSNTFCVKQLGNTDSHESMMVSASFKVMIPKTAGDLNVQESKPRFGSINS